MQACVAPFGEETCEVFDVPIVLGVVSDTHVRRPRALPEALVAAFRQVDLILHAGDVTSVAALELFEEIAPVRAVVGNNDELALRLALPMLRIFRFGGFTAGMMHGHGFERLTARKAAERELVGRVDLAIFGHSHRPVCEWIGETLLFNPGSATDRRWEPRHSFGMIRISDTIDPELCYLP
jgi:putative phosphoesterase